MAKTQVTQVERNALEERLRNVIGSGVATTVLLRVIDDLIEVKKDESQSTEPDVAGK